MERLLSFCNGFVRSMASGYAKRLSMDYDDLYQEGMLKVHKFLVSEDMANLVVDDILTFKLRRIAKNAMIDLIRSERCYKNHNEVSDLVELVVPQEDDTFKRIVREETIKEMYRLLSDTDREVLAQLINPTEEFRLFVRKKKVIDSIFGKRARQSVLVHDLSLFLKRKFNDVQLSIRMIRDLSVKLEVAC